MFVFPQQLLIYICYLSTYCIGRAQSACMSADRKHVQIVLYEVLLFWLLQADCIGSQTLPSYPTEVSFRWFIFICICIFVLCFYDGIVCSVDFHLNYMTAIWALRKLPCNWIALESVIFFRGSKIANPEDKNTLKFWQHLIYLYRCGGYKCCS